MKITEKGVAIIATGDGKRRVVVRCDFYCEDQSEADRVEETLRNCLETALKGLKNDSSEN